MKSQKGMSHIMATIAIVIIIVIIVFVVRIFLKESEDTQIENQITDMLLVQGKIKVVSKENIVKKDESPLIGKAISENLEDEEVKKLIDKEIISTEEEDFENYYIIDSESIKELELENDMTGKIYLVNYETYEIIDSKGIDIEGKTYYTLTSLLEYKDEKEKEEKKDDNVNQEEVEEQQSEEKPAEENGEEKTEETPAE